MLAAFCLFVALDWAWKAGYVYAAVGVGVVAACLGEYERMAGRLGMRVPRAALVYGGVAIFLLQWAGWVTTAFPDPWLSAVAIVALLAMGLLADRVLHSQVEGSMEAVGALALGLAYVPLLVGFLTAVRAALRRGGTDHRSRGGQEPAPRAPTSWARTSAASASRRW